MRDEPLAEALKGTLREGRRFGAEAVENHLPSEVHNRELDRFGV